MSARSTELLRDLDDDQRAALTALATTIRLSAGDTLFRLGDDANCIYSIEWGRIALTLPMRVRDRDEDVLVEERLPGEMVGWSAVIAPHRMTLTATALSEVELTAIPRAPLIELLKKQPEIGYAFMHNVGVAVGHRLQVVQAMWLREMQRFVSIAHA
jgi:CRP-like cAMP-binding protein